MLVLIYILVGCRCSIAAGLSIIMGFDKWLTGSVLDVFTMASPLLSSITTGIYIVFCGLQDCPGI